MSLKQFEENIQSQNGEDGVVAELYRRIGTTNKICIEFGAWDGKHYSNTWNLWHNEGWQAYLIEGSIEKSEVLKENVAAFPKVVAINRFVRPEGPDSLDQILAAYEVPRNPDLLSIDIDGDDYHILAGLMNYRPRVIVIEYNPTVPPTVEMVQEPGQYLGASSLSLIKLAEAKGYVAVHMTQTNLFFMAGEIPEAGTFGFDLARQFDNSHLVNVITSYDGIAYLSASLPYRGELPELRKPTLRSLLKSMLGKQPPAEEEPRFTSSTRLLPVDLYKRKRD